MNESGRKTETDSELKLALHIVWGPVGYHSVWRHKAELALLWMSSETASTEGPVLHESSTFTVKVTSVGQVAQNICKNENFFIFYLLCLIMIAVFLWFYIVSFCIKDTKVEWRKVHVEH